MCDALQVPEEQYPNACNINFYDDNQGLGPHSNDEHIMGVQSETYIISVSMGATKTMAITKKRGEPQEKNMLLEQGDVVIMGGHMQKHYNHGIDSGEQEKEARTNLTFRWTVALNMRCIIPRLCLPAPIKMEGTTQKEGGEEEEQD